jgi:ATP sulfurylase
MRPSTVEEWTAYMKTDEWKKDFETVSKLIQEDNWDGVVEFMNRDAPARAREAVQRMEAK